MEKFYSNPPLPDIPRVIPEEVDGIIRNKVVNVSHSNKSPFDGIVYNPDTMSLRAKLNLGIQMSKVSFGQIENDPNVLNRRALVLEKQIYDRFAELSELSPVPVDPSSVPVDPSPVSVDPSSVQS